MKERQGRTAGAPAGSNGARAGSWRGALVLLLAAAVFAGGSRALGSANRTSTQVYLFESGVPVNESATDGYEEPIVIILSTQAEIGTVPDPTAGWIYNSDNQTIGFIAPSTAATQELP